MVFPFCFRQKSLLHHHTKSSWDIFKRASFKEWLVHSTLPEDWGWYGIWKCQGILRAVDRFWEIWEVNSGPLSDWREVGIPNRGMISQRSTLETAWALLVVGNSSTHPDIVSTKTRRYLTLLTVGIWVNFSCQSVPGRKPLAWWVGKGKLRYLFLGSDFWQIWQEAVIAYRNFISSGMGWR